MIPFSKMHGIGNDFVMIDALQFPLGVRDLHVLARSMCDRRFGIGSDGLIIAEAGDAAPFRMRMFNPDGSESEMCGNGIRCLAELLHGHGHVEGPDLDVETGAGVLHLVLKPDGQVQVDMGLARLERREIPVAGDPTSSFIAQPIETESGTLLGTAVSMGNPHVVFFVEDAGATPLQTLGPAIENHPLFPRRTNVHFVQVSDRHSLIQRTWERGAGITLACGTGACACAVAAFLNGKAEREVNVRLPGGTLHIEYLESGRVMMTGPAETVFTGEWAES